MSKDKPLNIIVKFTIPLMIANLFQMLYTTVDTMVIGKSVGAVAAYSAVYKMDSLMMQILATF